MMYNKLAPVFGSLALASLVSAAPMDRGSPSYSASASGGSWGGSDGGHSGSYSVSSTYQTDAPAPTLTNDQLPLSNGFPNIANPSKQLDDINEAAHGTLPNGPPPPAAPAADDILSLRFIAFNELFEVFFFSELLQNITNNVDGFTFEDSHERQIVIDAITAVQAQEELHLLNANGALAKFDTPIQPCKYISPATDFKSAIAFAQTFTDVVLGTLPDVQTHFGLNGDNGLIRGVGAVIGQEGEQNGFYRNLQHKIPSANAFLTASTRELAFNALLQNVIVPGSCPDLSVFAGLGKPFGVLSLDTPADKINTDKDTTLSFSISAEGDWSHYASGPQDLSLVYINQQNVPIVQSIQYASHDNGKIHFTANFPFEENLLFGLTIAVLAKGNSFADVVAVTNATVFGPALIEVL
ncbi:hypothetical protein LTR84_011140 [Exophiala bonariae]|uniref:Late sexual development protein n=1 Tax=Exophiala bonariae TaxID=1690606 RepID=A0AAV9NKS4_9EURO|nr:hypothetical protein LTR84_011140 [Exophiala bonariae]